MKGTSEPRWSRKTASVAASLSPTRARKRSGDGGVVLRRRSSAAGLKGWAVIARSCHWLDGREGVDGLEVAVAEAVDLALLEIPPVGLDVVGVGGAVDAVRLAGLMVGLLLLVGAQRGEELAQGVEEVGVLDRHRHRHRAALLHAARDVHPSQLLAVLALRGRHRDGDHQLEVVVEPAPGEL